LQSLIEIIGVLRHGSDPVEAAGEAISYSLDETKIDSRIKEKTIQKDIFLCCLLLFVRQEE
jgi:hypothetical protein